MTAPYRDTYPKIEWAETTTVRTVLVSRLFDYADPAAFFADGWRIKGDTQGSGFPITTPATTVDNAFDGDSWWSFQPGGNISLAGFVAFWIDDPGGPPFVLGPLIRQTWMEKTYSGLPPLTPVGFRIRGDWQLDSGFGNIFIEIGGVRHSYANGTFNFWTIPSDISSGLTDYYLVGVTDALGDVQVKIGGENYQTSGNVICYFQELEIVDMSCSPVTTNYEVRFPYPLEDVRSFSAMRPGSEQLWLPSGEGDAWILGHDGILEGEVRWIPAVSGLALPLNDGWEDRDDSGTIRAGWDRFLRHAQAGGAFTFYPDENDAGVSYPCLWAGDRAIAPSLEDDMVRSVPFRIRTTDESLIEGYSQ